MAFPATVLGIRVALDRDGSLTYATDITGDVEQRADITINRGRPDEASAAQPSDCSMTIDNRLGDYTLRNPTGQYYGTIGRNTPIRVSVDAPTSWLVITTDTGTTPVAGTSVSTPDAASLDIVGDIDIRFDADLDSWGEAMELVTKWTTTANQRSYALTLSSTGALILWWSTTGTNIFGFTSQILPVVTGRLAVRVTLDVDNGAGGCTATFYTSDTIAGTWTQLGAAQVGGATTSIFASTAILSILDNPNSDLAGSVIRGKVYGAQVLNGIAGTAVANPDFTAQTNGATSFADTATPAKTWTLNGTVALSNRDVRFLGEVSAWPNEWDTSGRDIYVQLTAAGVFRRLGQGDPPAQSVLRRSLGSLTALRAYWPCEDPVGSTTIASAVAGVPAMTFASNAGNTVNLATNTDFASSLPIPEFNGVAFSANLPTASNTGDIQVRFLLSVPAAGAVDGKVICRIYTAGTAPRWDLIYNVGGALTLTAYDVDGTVLMTSGAVAFAINGLPLRMSIELDGVGATVAWRMTTMPIGSLSGSTNSGVLGASTVLRATGIRMNVQQNHLDVAVGHITVESAISGFSSAEVSQLNAYAGETAGRRIQRLCREQSLGIQSFGDLDNTAPMGPQTPLKLLDLLNECADADLGILAESKDMLGVSYRPRTAVINQVSQLTIPYTSVNPLGPIEDDAQLTNDVTVSRANGSSARSTLDSGPNSTLAPPLGANRYPTSLAINVQLDTQLPDQAAWRMHVGTVNEARYPGIGVNLAYPAVTASAAVTAQLRGLDVGERFVVTSPPAGRTAPGSVSQILQGQSEALNAQAWTMVLKGSPESVWRVATYALAASTAIAPTASKYSSDGTVLAVAVNSSATSWSISTPSGPLWTTAAAEFPFDWIVSGEQVTVTAITGTTTPQTATVTRSVNGVVKAQLINAVIALNTPAVYGF